MSGNFEVISESMFVDVQNELLKMEELFPIGHETRHLVSKARRMVSDARISNREDQDKYQTKVKIYRKVKKYVG